MFMRCKWRGATDPYTRGLLSYIVIFPRVVDKEGWESGISPFFLEKSDLITTVYQVRFMYSTEKE